MLSRGWDRFRAEKRHFYEVQQPHHPAIKFYLVVLVGIEEPQDHGPVVLLLVCWLFRSVRAPFVLSLVVLVLFFSCMCRARAAIFPLEVPLSLIVVSPGSVAVFRMPGSYQFLVAPPGWHCDRSLKC